jgi:hypothetical protein
MATVRVGFDAAGTALDYSTSFAAIAGITAGDTIEVWYSTATKCTTWYQTVVTVNKACTITGGLPNRQISLLTNTSHLAITATGVTVSNLTFLGTAASSAGTCAVVCGATGTTTNILDCTAIGCWGLTYTNGFSALAIVKNCEVIGAQLGLRIAGGNIQAYNVTAIDCVHGFYFAVSGASANIVKNCVAINNLTTDYFGTFYGTTSSNNISSDGTHPGTSGATISADDSGIGRFGANGTYIVTGRVTDPASALLSGGVDVGLTADIDGQAYTAGVFPRGCTSKAIRPFVADFPSPANVLDTDTVDGVQGTYTGASANDVRLNTPIGQTNGNMVLPEQPDVRNLVGYGSKGTELIGSLEVGASPVASVLALVSVGDGVVTLSVDAETETLKTYIRYRSGMNDWSEFSETFAITGSGNIAITPLANGVRYEFVGIVDDNGVYSLPSNSVIATPSSGCEPARINGIADEIVAILDSANLCQGVTPERVYIHNERMAKITNTQIWVQPSANEIISDSRGADRNNYTIDVGVFAKCITTAETDAVMDVAHAVYLIMRRQEFIDGAKVYQVEMPTLFSPDYLQQNNLFAAVVSVMVADRIP